jgi:hypothetical protein
VKFVVDPYDLEDIECKMKMIDDKDLRITLGYWL